MAGKENKYKRAFIFEKKKKDDWCGYIKWTEFI